MQLQLVVLILSVVARLVWRGGGRLSQTASTTRSRRTALHVITRFHARDPWREHVLALLASARAVPVQVSVLLECSSEAHERDASDALLSSAVHIEVGVAGRRAHPNAVARRLARRLVSGDEEVVVLLLGGARLRAGWDEQLLPCRPALRDGAVISCPPPAADGTPRFPTLRRRSNGTAARDTARAFRGPATDDALVPSVCWCPEVTVLSGQTARAWTAAKTDSLVDQTARAPHYALQTPLLECHSHAEDDMIDHDEGSATHELRSCELAGLTRTSTGDERIRKYGTLFAARLAIDAARGDDAAP